LLLRGNLHLVEHSRSVEADISRAGRRRVRPAEGPFLAALFGVGGIGTGLGFTGIVDHLTNHVGEEHAPDLTGLIGTNSEVFGAIGVATFGSLFLGLAPHPAGEVGHRAFVVVVGFGLAALAASASAYRSITAGDQPRVLG
jgi:hypothetical protein